MQKHFLYFFIFFNMFLMFMYVYCRFGVSPVILVINIIIICHFIFIFSGSFSDCVISTSKKCNENLIMWMEDL